MDTDIKHIISKLFDSKFYVIYDLNIKYVLALILDIFQDSRIIEEFAGGQDVSLKELINRLNFSPQAEIPLEWMLDFSSENGLLQRTRHNSTFYYQLLPGHFDKTPLRNKILSLDATFKPSLDLMNLVSQDYVAFLKGNKKGVEILFSSDGMKLWREYFNNKFSGYRIFNILGAYAIVDLLQSKENVCLLELGGGTGGATEILFNCLYDFDRLNRLDQYIFSDISPTFVRMRNKECLDKEFQRVNYSSRKINFDLPLIEQGIARNSVDIIYAVNAIHAAKDLILTLKNIKKILKKDGILVISELIRDNNVRLFQEIIFCLLDSYANVKLDRRFRPSPGFLSECNWIRAFKEIGFTTIKTINNTAMQEGHKKIGLVVQGIK